MDLLSHSIRILSKCRRNAKEIMTNAYLLSLSMHEVLTYRTNEYASMSPRSKSFIKWLRHGQLGLRVLQLVAALGLLALMLLIDKVPTLEGWVMRITVRPFHLIVAWRN